MNATEVVAALVAYGLTVATAESLTGGLVCGELTSVPGASATVVGSVVSYATRVKRDVLGVDGALLDREGAVDPDVAAAMAAGVCQVLGADVGVSTTGVAGPDPQDGKPVGLVFVAVAWPARHVVRTRMLNLDGDRAAIRAATVSAAVALLGAVVTELGDGPGKSPAWRDVDTPHA